ncbi:MAG: hypothetical protein JXR49_22935 [Acidobacteria bacterium]|nr:hypothetical protein [Acidobacteriota bacterium]
MKTIFLFIVAFVLAVAACGCSDGGQTGYNNSTQNYTPGQEPVDLLRIWDSNR